MITLFSAGVMNQTMFGSGSGYADSTLKTKLEEIADGFSADERNAIAGRNLAAADDIGGDAVENALLWPLSTWEAQSLDNAFRVLNPNPSAVVNSWWLRSPGTESGKMMAVTNNGLLRDCNAEDASLSARPALYLKSESLLLAISAAGGTAAVVLRRKKN